MAAIVPTVTSTPTNSAVSNGVGALSSLDQSTYDFSTTRYPLSVGTSDAPHYVVFNINLPDGSQYVTSAGGAVANVQSASQQNYDLTSSQGGGTQLNALAATGGGAATGAIGAIVGPGSVAGGAITGGVQSGGLALLNNTINLKPKLTRVKKAIALYMPDTVAFQYEHDWQTTSLTDAQGRAGADAALGSGIKNVSENLYDDAKGWVKTGNLGDTFYNNAQGAEAIGRLGQVLGAGSGFTDLALSSVNRALNPQVEMVFKGTANRTFTFVFDFQPRNSTESQDILDIINTFRTYAAPEISSEGNGRYFIPPGEFDIKFYMNNVENTNLPRISTCALISIGVDYNHSGHYATFPDGMPVHINMQLIFKEMDIITRNLISQFGF